MKRLLYLRDSERFWQVFSEERDKTRAQLASLPYTDKIRIMARMRDLFPRPNSQSKSSGSLIETEGEVD